ncbi:hypothetical protein ACOMHN_000449 [Nucella lapillus]
MEGQVWTGSVILRSSGGGGDDSRPDTCFRRMVRRLAKSYLTEDGDRRFYTQRYTCFPPPVFMPLILVLEVGCFVYYCLESGRISVNGPVPVHSVFIYRPDRRVELWRFVFYMLLHAGYVHLLFNVVVQVMVGIPLEMVHGSFRVFIIYMAGVLAASTDVGFAIWDRYSYKVQEPSVGYTAHLMGALAGLTIGLVILRNFEEKLHEQYVWWIALAVYLGCSVFAVFWNIFYY